MCVDRGACVGGDEICAINHSGMYVSQQLDADHQSGTLCAVCTDGTTKVLGRCIDCVSTSVIPFIVIPLAVVLLCIYFFVWKANSLKVRYIALYLNKLINIIAGRRARKR